MMWKMRKWLPSSWRMGVIRCLRCQKECMPNYVGACMKLQERMMKNLAAIKTIKTQVHNWLDRFFPEFCTVFKNWEGKATLHLSKKGYLPSDLVSMPSEQLLAEVKRGVGIRRMEQLKEAVQASVGLSADTKMVKNPVWLPWFPWSKKQKKCWKSKEWTESR